MTTTETAAPAAKKEDTRRWVRRPGDTAGILEINGCNYVIYAILTGARVVADLFHEEAEAFLLMNLGNGNVYRVTNRLVPTCSCPDFRYRRGPKDPDGCKHTRSAKAGIQKLQEVSK